MKNIKIYFSDLLWLFLVFAVFIVSSVYPENFGKVVVIFAVASIIELIVRFRSSDVMVIFLFFSLTYPLYLFAYYFFDISYHYLVEYQNHENTSFVLLLQTLFIRMVFLFLTAEDLVVYRLVYPKRKNSLIFSVYALILTFMIPVSLFFHPPDLGGVYTGDVQYSIWLEYSVVFILIASLYADNKGRTTLLFLICLVYLLLPLLYGRRLPFVIIALLMFNIFFSGRLKFSYIVSLLFLSFVGLRLFAYIRVGADAGIVSSIISLNEDGVMSNNQGGVVIASVAYLEMIKQGVFDWSFRLTSFLGALLSTILPSSVNFKEVFINFAAAKHTPIPGNGGLTSIYLYIWGGFFGVLVGGMIFRFFLVRAVGSRVFAVFIMFAFSVFPRWHSYNLFILIKMGFWLFFFLMITDVFHKYVRFPRK